MGGQAVRRLARSLAAAGSVAAAAARHAAWYTRYHVDRRPRESERQPQPRERR